MNPKDAIYIQVKNRTSIKKYYYHQIEQEFSKFINSQKRDAHPGTENATFVAHPEIRAMKRETQTNSQLVAE